MGDPIFITWVLSHWYQGKYVIKSIYHYYSNLIDPKSRHIWLTVADHQIHTQCFASQVIWWSVPLPVKAAKFRPLSREGSLSCHTCCDTGPQFFRSHPKDSPILSPLTTHKGMWRIYSYLDPHGPPIQSPLTTHKGVWRTYSNPNPHGYLEKLIPNTEKYSFL
jgi:hypothetical protein